MQYAIAYQKQADNILLANHRFQFYVTSAMLAEGSAISDFQKMAFEEYARIESILRPWQKEEDQTGGITKASWESEFGSMDSAETKEAMNRTLEYLNDLSSPETNQQGMF